MKAKALESWGSVTFSVSVSILLSVSWIFLVPCLLSCSFLCCTVLFFLLVKNPVLLRFWCFPSWSLFSFQYAWYYYSSYSSFIKQFFVNSVTWWLYLDEVNRRCVIFIIVVFAHMLYLLSSVNPLSVQVRPRLSKRSLPCSLLSSAASSISSSPFQKRRQLYFFGGYHGSLWCFLSKVLLPPSETDVSMATRWSQ